MQEQKFCACGCGNEVKPGRTWKLGHHNRVNPISKRADIRQKRREYLQYAHAAGLRPEIWNKGLKDDPRCLVGAQKAAVTKMANPLWRANAADSMRRNRKTLAGENHPMWKGGSSEIVRMIRGNQRFYKLWKLPILVRDKFCCQLCGADRKLQVHHNDITFAEIIAKFLPEDRKNMTFEQKKIVIDEIINYHVSNSVNGVTLCVSCHKTFHRRVE